MPPGSRRSARARKAVSRGVSATRIPAATTSEASGYWPKLIEWEPVTLPPWFGWPPYTFYPTAICRPVHGGTPVTDIGQGGSSAKAIFAANYRQIPTIQAATR